VNRICSTFHLEPLRPQMKAIADVVGDGNTLDVAVLGRFKAGKSSFLNNILGRRVMPVGVLPITAIVTRICQGPRERVLLHFLDGRTEEVPLARLPDFVTEENNPANVKQVAIVDVELPGLDAYRGLRFVDTPGLGSVFAHNTRAAMDWLPRVGVSLLAISVDQPLSEDDLRILRDLVRQTPEIMILVTKADLVSRDELEAVVQFIRQQIERGLKREIVVFPFSVRDGFENLREGIRAFLTQAGGRCSEKARSIVNHKLRTLLEDTLSYLRMAMSAATAAEESRRSLRRLLADERGELAVTRNEIRVLTRDIKNRAQAEAYLRFQQHTAPLASRLIADLLVAQASWKGHLKRTVNDFREWATANLLKQLEPLSADQGVALAQKFLHEANGSLARLVRAFQDRLAAQIQEALQISFSGADFVADVIKPKRPDISVGRVFDTHLDLLWFLIPMAIFRPLVHHRFRRIMSWEAAKNLYRLASQWSRTIDLCIDDLARQVESFIVNELTTVESLVAEAPDRTLEIEKAIRDLQRLQQDVALAAAGQM
jgi:GTP-binding protein EngB required for normal cell division